MDTRHRLDGWMDGWLAGWMDSWLLKEAGYIVTQQDTVTELRKRENPKTLKQNERHLNSRIFEKIKRTGLCDKQESKEAI